ncbi:hypothetical protein HK102_007650 [Quaeritorhiza haematococci]|nr:hypothetical protein HK102_007650 [Quaeritorhiza haematococci]
MDVPPPENKDILNTTLSSILWILFAHFSQTFDWLGFYVWATNEFSIRKPLVRALVMMPFIRFWGDVLYRILDQATTGRLKSTYPAVFWYIGEIFGDSYLPYKALAMLGVGGSTPSNSPRMQRFYRVAIISSFSLFAGTKVAQIVYRFVAEYGGLNLSDVNYFRITSYFDSVVCFLGVFADLVCCAIMYRQSKELSKFRETGLLTTIKNSSVFRLTLAVAFKLMNGVFLILNPCESEAHVCYYGFLRSVLTTIDYQFYYMDFFFSRYASAKGTTTYVSQSTPMKKQNNSVIEIASMSSTPSPAAAPWANSGPKSAAQA